MLTASQASHNQTFPGCNTARGGPGSCYLPRWAITTTRSTYGRPPPLSLRIARWAIWPIQSQLTESEPVLATYISPLLTGEQAHQSTKGKGKRKTTEDDSDLSSEPESRDSKRRRTDSSEDSFMLENFELSSLVKVKDGTFQTPRFMRKYLEKHLRRCLSKEEREAIFKEHLKPDLYVPLQESTNL